MNSRKQKTKGTIVPFAYALCSVALYAVLMIHFFIVGFNQLPDNPLQHQYKIELSNYVDPYFSQAWTLFSPNPINSNMNLLVQFEYVVNNKKISSDWIDVSEPIARERELHFWSPAQRISKYLSACMQNINDNHREFFEYIKQADTLSLSRDSTKINKMYTKSMSSTYGHKSIMQYSAFVAKNYFSSVRIQPDSVKIRYKVFNAKFPRFSKRNLDYYDLKNYSFTQLTSDLYPLNY